MQALNGFLIVLQHDNIEEDGGIIIPEASQQSSQKGTVVSASPGSYLKEQDIVLFGRNSGSPIILDGVSYLMLREAEVYARL